MLLKAYITYARPKLEFTTTVWNPGQQDVIMDYRQAQKFSEIVHKEVIWYLQTTIYYL